MNETNILLSNKSKKFQDITKTCRIFFKKNYELSFGFKFFLSKINAAIFLRSNLIYSIYIIELDIIEFKI